MKKNNLLGLLFATLIMSCDQQYPELDKGLYANIETNKGEIILGLGRGVSTLKLRLLGLIKFPV